MDLPAARCILCEVTVLTAAGCLGGIIAWIACTLGDEPAQKRRVVEFTQPPANPIPPHSRQIHSEDCT